MAVRQDGRLGTSDCRALKQLNQEHAENTRRYEKYLHVPRVGDLVVAKWPPYRDNRYWNSKTGNPWFAGTIRAINWANTRSVLERGLIRGYRNQWLTHATWTCTVEFADGNISDGVRGFGARDAWGNPEPHEVLFAPNRSDGWGKENLRGIQLRDARFNDMTPAFAQPCREWFECGSTDFGQPSCGEYAPEHGKYQKCKEEEDTHRWEMNSTHHGRQPCKAPNSLWPTTH